MGVIVIPASGIVGLRASGFLGDFPFVAGDLSGEINSGQVSLSVQPPPAESSIHAPAANTAAVITLAAVAAQRHRLQALGWSYNAAPTGGLITVADGGTTIWQQAVTAAGPGNAPLPIGGLVGTVNTAMTITLAAAGAAVTGIVSAARITG